MTPTPTRPEPTTPTREELRAAGLSVAVHNDYRLNGEQHTFWLFTHPDGWYVKGEGKSDGMALFECVRALKQYLASEPAGPQSHDSNVMFDIAIMATAHQPDDAIFSISFKDLRRLNATIQALETELGRGPAASTGARGAVVEEIAKRRARVTFTAGEHNEIVERLPPHFRVRVSKELGQYELDIAKLLALIGAKQP